MFSLSVFWFFVLNLPFLLPIALYQPFQYPSRYPVKIYTSLYLVEIILYLFLIFQKMVGGLCLPMIVCSWYLQDWCQFSASILLVFCYCNCDVNMFPTKLQQFFSLRLWHSLYKGLSTRFPACIIPVFFMSLLDSCPFLLSYCIFRHRCRKWLGVAYIHTLLSLLPKYYHSSPIQIFAQVLLLFSLL